MIKVKICGITNIEDAKAAIEFGADALGFVFYDESPRAITPDKARSVVAEIPPFITTVGVFVNEKPETIDKISSFVGLNAIQLHGSEPPEACDLSRKVVKAIRVKELSDLNLLSDYKDVSAFLIDTFTPDAFGGTGQVFNWDIAIEAKKFGHVILAGGLTPENIKEAIKKVSPYGVDVSSGVENDIKGMKDHSRLKLFIETAKRIF